MAERLPPLHALRVFEVAARRLSFTQAAEELHLTQGAVSRQIRLLEEFLGKALFVRLTRRVTLTDEGRDLLGVAQLAFRDLERTVARIRGQDDRRVLTLRVLPTLASLWLMPRLTEFTSTFKGIEVRIVTSIEPVDFALGNVDLAIGCGPLPGKRYNKAQPRVALSMVTDWEGVEARELFPDVLVPVLSRQLASQLAPISKPADLCRSRLIHTASRATAWPDWLRAHDVDWRRSRDDIDFGHFFMSLQAAREGRGIAIVPSVLLQNYEGRSELVQPLDAKLPSAAEYYLLTHERTADEAAVRQLGNWLMTQARAMTH